VGSAKENARAAVNSFMIRFIVVDM
jgi:hypothetical protein